MSQQLPRRSRRASPSSYVVIDDLPALIWAANLAALELHVPMWRFARPRRRDRTVGAEPGGGADPEVSTPPDLLVFDLDPGAPATIVDCCRVAEALRPVLAEGRADAAAQDLGRQGAAAVRATGFGTVGQDGRAGERAGAGLRGAARARAAAAGRLADDEVACARARCSSTGRRTTSPRPRSRPTRCAPGTSHRLDPGHLGRGGRLPRGPADLYFTAPDVLARVEAHGDLFAPLLR